ncbi:MAG: Uncharacterized protein FD138_132 [Planctomycetota bacterium]|nr:MAG: Uncharacterized protein FD138_132 [Planctomycetota bacterium]
MEVVNDAQLMELVREPAKELLPSARRASVVQPLIVLMAFVPGLFGFWNRSLDESTCRQGLLAFEVTAGERPIDWLVTASRGAADRSAHAVPLATLLTAVGLEVELLSPESRLLLVSYLSSVLLLLCLGSLAKSIGGSRLALLTVCLACGHRELLTLSESLPPVALPLALAVLSFRGLVVHQTAGESLMSGSLLASGFALGACCLSGAEVAVASWCVLLVVSVLSAFSTKESTARVGWRRVLRQTLSNVMIAQVSLLVVTLIALSVVVGWQSAFAEGISLPSLGEPSAWFRRAWSVESQATAVGRAVLQTIGAWLGFVLLGAVQVVRGRMKFSDGAGTRGLWFLVGWSAVALISGWVTWPTEQGDRTRSLTGLGFFLLPTLLLAASGMEAVLRREFRLGWVVAATLVTIGVHFAPDWRSWQPSSQARSWLVTSALMAALVIGGGLLLFRRVAKSESLSRIVLLSCVTILVLMDVSEGILSRPPLADDERELLAFRRQLITETPPEECWLLSEEASPARLRFFLRSLWHDVSLHEASDWETVVASSRRAVSTHPKVRAIVVSWGSPKLAPQELKRRGQALSQATTPHHFQGRLLKGFRWIDRAEGLSSR